LDLNAEMVSSLRCDSAARAATHGLLKGAELLVEAGADVDGVMEPQPGKEETVLQVAAPNDKAEVVQLLLRGGASVDPSGNVLLEAAGRWSWGHRQECCGRRGTGQGRSGRQQGS
jgi:hypothetical protein